MQASKDIRICSSISKSIAVRASGGRRIKASTFLRDFPADTTMSILKCKCILCILTGCQLQHNNKGRILK